MAGKKASKATKNKKPKADGGVRHHNAPLVISYGIAWESERGGLLNRIIRELGFSLRKVNPSQLNDPVGYLAGVVAYRPAVHPFEGEAPEGEFLLLCNLGKRQLDDFLLALKAVGVTIPHKAVLTKENRDWPFSLLMSQVSQEHEQLAAIAASDGDDK